MAEDILLRMTDITKTFPGVKALDHVSLEVEAGTVHALMGENGAGKSTLMKCLFGIYEKDDGHIYLEGREINFRSSKEALMNGVAMVHRARGVLADLEFMQFHPTSLYNPAEKPAFLITEAMRGAGAILKDFKGHEFMHKYDARLSLAPRDIVARAIDNEMKIAGVDHLYLDARGIGKDELINGFPTIYAKCLELGINITKDMIPIRPAAHYQCGGIKVDRNGESSIKHLYAAGECACTGLHGGNRLASNSLLEAVVYAHNAAMSAINQISQSSQNTPNSQIPDWNAEGMVLNEEMVLITQTKRELQELMWNYVGIVRSDLRLQRAFDRLNLISARPKTSTIVLCSLRS